MEYKDNGLPMKDFGIAVHFREESQEIGKLFKQHYSDARFIDSPGYDGTSHNNYPYIYKILNTYEQDHGFNTEDVEKIYTLEEFKSLLKGKDHIVNSYPIY